MITLLYIHIITSRRIHKRLKFEQDRLSLALAGGLLGLWDFDIKNNIIIYIGAPDSPQEEISLTLQEWILNIHPEDRDNVKILIDKTTRGENERFEAEFRISSRSGNWLWFIANGKIVERNPRQGTPVRACGTYFDITERKKYELRLKENNDLLLENYSRIQELNNRLNIIAEQAQESDRLKTAFLSNVSHEIRTPLNGIMGFTELLETDDTEQEEKARFLQIIRKSGEHLLSLINDIIEVARNDSETPLNIAPVNPYELLKSLQEFYNMNPRVKEKNMQVVLDVPEEYRKWETFSDSDRLRQILSNLIENAIKYTNTGSITLGFSITEHNIDRFFVKDTGQGIPEKYKEKIFERFFQVDYGNKIREGTGLGLSICRHLVNLLGGEIWLESQPGQGTTFYFTVNNMKNDPE